MSDRQASLFAPRQLRAGFGTLGRWHFINLGKFTSTGAAVEFINRFLGEILPPGNVDRFEPALFPPPPSGAGCLSD